MKARTYLTLLLAGASGLVVTTVARAQDNAPSATAAPTPDAKGKSQPSNEEIIVTGSRTITNGNASPTPVTVVSAQDALKMTPSTIADALNTLPVFSGSRGQVSNPSGGNAGQSGGGNSAGNNLNIRNLGAVRTLILFEGHRVPSTNSAGVVDIDMIPQQLLQRVDVVTGGASAVYGSDAVAGVVNFITNRHFNGLKFNTQGGITQLGDDKSVDVGVAAGHDLFGGRGHIEGSYEYRNDQGVDRRSSRSFLTTVPTVQGGGTATNPYYLAQNARVTTSTFGGLINSGALNGMTFDQNGVANAFVHGTSAGGTNTEIGGDGVYFDASLKAPLISHQAFLRGDYDISDHVHAYLQGTFNSKFNSSFTSWTGFSTLTLSSQDAYLAPTYQAQLAAAGQSTFTMSKQMMDAPRQEIDVQSRQFFVNGGLDGTIGTGIKWDAGFVHSSAKLDQINPTNINNGRLYASLDAVTNQATGQIACRANVVSGLYAGCVPLNPFGPTTDSAAAVSYFLGTTHYIAYTGMDDFAGSLSGSPLSTWAGAVNVALSGEYRRVSFHSTSDATPTDMLDCTGLRYNCKSTTTTWATTVAPRSLVSQTVKEGALEVNVPLLKDSALGKSFSVNAATRYTDYNTSGTYWTWKIGLDWQLTSELRLRGTRSRDIRAPTLDDLYSPTSVNSTGTFPDALTGTSPVVTTVTSGNPNLKAEVGNTLTAGFVYKPAWLRGFSLAVDYYNIKVTNAILNLQAMNPTLQKACYDSGGTSPYCALQVRPGGFTSTAATNVPTTVYNTVINVAQQTTQGLDIEANYATRVLNRPVSVRVLSTWQPHLKYIQPNLPTLEQAGAAFAANGLQAAPKLRITGFLSLSPIDDFDMDFQIRYRDSLGLSADPTLVSVGRVPAVTFVNMNLAYRIKTVPGRPQLFLNVSNLFNQAPPAAGFYGAQTTPGQAGGFVIGDDPLGRAFTVGLRAQF